MTIVVGVRCTDGVVIGSDGSATFAIGNFRTIEQPTRKKIHLIDDRLLIAASGNVGHFQRLVNAVDRNWQADLFDAMTPIEAGKWCSTIANREFSGSPPPPAQNVNLPTLMAFAAGGSPVLCELERDLFQPEIKEPDSIWHVSIGSGQPITDPFFGFLRSTLLQGATPNLHTGIFVACWALLHACEVNPGGINEPIRLAVLEPHEGDFRARFLPDEELEEHRTLVRAANNHIAEFVRDTGPPNGDSGGVEETAAPWSSNS